MPLVTRPSRGRPAPRRGSAIVEAAIVLPIFFLFIFGVFEYARFLLVLNVTTNAARDAARWAAVHANDRRTADSSVAGVPTANYTLYGPVSDARLTATTSPKPYVNAPYGAARRVYNVPFVTDYAVTRMGPVADMISRRGVWVFPADTAELYTPNTVRAKVLPKTGTSSWKEAAFTERIAVQILGDFRPILPSFLFMDGVVPVSVIGLSPSEG